MIPLQDRCSVVVLIDEAMASGARQSKASAEVGISARTLQRWRHDGEVKSDARPTAARPTPQHKLTEQERQQVLDVCHSDEFKSLPPSQVVPTLADRGEYIASESSYYRILADHKENNRRGRANTSTPKPPTTHIADGPNQVWCWDITYLAGPVKGLFFYLYLIIDLYSRKIVGFEVYDEESGEHAANLVERTVRRENAVIHPLVLHSDNGAPMKSYTLREKLKDLNVNGSYSRPRVSNDNAFVESFFRTCKYRPDYPLKGFVSLEAAREWVLSFSRWYNLHHKHSSLKFVTPEQRHTGQDGAVLAERKALYEEKKAVNPRRWSGNTRNWELGEQVALNPEKLPARTAKTACAAKQQGGAAAPLPLTVIGSSACTAKAG
jgi:transposase InsO family protein